MHEFILDHLPPFCYLPRFWALISQLIVMEIAGLACVVAFSLPTRSAVLGSLAILAVVAWSAVAHFISRPLMLAKLPESPQDRRTVARYRRLVFSRRHYEALAGSVFAILLVLYFIFFGTNDLEYWLGGNYGVLPLILSMLLLWEIGYRAGLGMLIALLAYLRSSWMRKTVAARGGYVPYGSLDYLEKTDLTSMAMAFPALLLLPLSQKDQLLAGVILTYSFFVVASSAGSILHLRRVPLYPDEIRDLLRTGKFAYFGTSDMKRRPHVTPVIFVFDGRSAFVVTAKVSKKLRNIKKNPNAAILIDIRDPEEPLNNRATLLTGRATIYGWLMTFTHPILMLRLRRIFGKKYPEYVREYKEKSYLLPTAWRTTILLRRLLIRVDVEKMIYWRKAKPIKLPT